MDADSPILSPSSRDSTPSPSQPLLQQESFPTSELPPLQKDPFGRFFEAYPGAAKSCGRGNTFMENFHSAEHAEERDKAPYYPFRSKDEWEHARFLLKSSLSMTEISEYLELGHIKKLQLSFKTAKELQSRAEILPSGPKWKKKPMPEKPGYKSIKQPVLYYRDPLECIQELMSRPELQNVLKLVPYKLYAAADRSERIYQERLSGDAAWSMQEKLQEGATLIETILSSDKTTISVMTGGRMAYPLYLSLGNLPMQYRLKATNNAYVLLALLPIPTYPKRLKPLASTLKDRLFHQSLDLVLLPLKQAAHWGKLMTDPLGYSRLCFTPLASCVVDTPESALIAGVGGSTSPVTMAHTDGFGDPFKHVSRSGRNTLQKIKKLQKQYPPWSHIRDYVSAAKELRLNAVHMPFWRNWPLAEPSTFITPEPLHHWHKMFWDHDQKWCTNAVGEQEINFRYSVLQPHTGFRHFHQGIAGLQQVTGREHRDMQRYIVAVIAEHVPADFLMAIRSLISFRYLGQALEINETLLQHIESELDTFHEKKDSIIAERAQRGKKGVIKNWNIPKMEFMHTVLMSIEQNGIPMQWTADATERAHKDKIKAPTRASNNQNYEAQICRSIDRLDKCAKFDLALTLCDLEIANCTATNPAEDENNKDEDHSFPQSSQGSSTIKQAPNPKEPSGQSLDYFVLAESISEAYQEQKRAGFRNKIPTPLRTFSTLSTAFHLARDPTWRRKSVSLFTQQFSLPDLKAALQEYVHRVDSKSTTDFRVGGRRSNREEDDLPFSELEVWKSFKVQGQSYFPPHFTLPARTIHALPPNTEKDWPLGRYEAGIINIDSSEIWPKSGLKGHQVVEARLIFRIVKTAITPISIPDDFLVYVQRFDIIPQVNPEVSGSRRAGPYPERTSSLYLMKKSFRTSGKEPERLGDIVPLSKFQSLVDLVPRFGDQADLRLQPYNSLDLSEEFRLNSFFEKDLFYALYNH